MKAERRWARIRLRREFRAGGRRLIVTSETEPRAERSHGFTLTELLLTISILGVLGAVTVLGVAGIDSVSTGAACTTDLGRLQRAETTYFQQTGRYGTEDELVKAELLREASELHSVTASGATYAVAEAGKCIGTSTSYGTPPAVVGTTDGSGATVAVVAGDGTGISGVAVEYKDAASWVSMGTTASTGQLNAALANGTYDFRITYRGTTNTLRGVGVQQGTMVTFPAVTLTVSFRDASNSPLAGGVVAVLSSGGSNTAFGTTNAAGIVTDYVLPAAYDVTMSFAGVSTVRSGQAVNSSQTITFTTGTLTVALQSGGTGVAGGAVSVTPVGGTATSLGTTDVSGRVSGTLINGTYTVTMLYQGVTSTQPLTFSTATTVTFALPGAPTGLAANGGNGSVALSWLAPVDSGSVAITDYLVEYRTSPSGPWNAFNDGLSTSTAATVTSLTAGTTYDFRVSARNAVGTGAVSTTATATPGSVPAAPTGVTTTPGNAQMALSWTAPVANVGYAVNDYAIEYRTSPSGAWTLFPDGVSTSTTATVTGLTNGTAYDFRVSAANSIGFGNASSAATGTPTNPLGAPTALTVRPASGALTVSWSAPAANAASVTSYQYQYRAFSTGTWSAWTTATSPATISGLSNGSAYDVAVRAVSSAGSGTSATSSAFAGGGIALWLDADQSSSITLASGAVQTWGDRSGNGRDVSAPSASVRPSSTAQTLNGRPVLTFNGSTVLQDMSGIANRYGITGDRTMVMVARYRTASTYFIDRASVTNNLFGVNGTVYGTGKLQVRDDSGGQFNNLGTITPAKNTGFLTTSTRSGSALSHYVAGALSATGTLTGTLTQPTISVGRHVSATSTADADVAEIILYNRALSTSEQRNLEEYLAAKWGLAIAPAQPTSVSATGLGGTATVRWTAPTSNGGSAVTSYTATASAAGQSTRTCTTSGTSCSIGSLSVGVAYSITVTATNVVGTGFASSPVTLTG